MSKVKEYILNSWDRTTHTCTSVSFDSTLIPLPFPYSVPSSFKETESVSGFMEMYYWDTYFLNVGLLLSRKTEQAINNANNMAFLIERYGFMPNGNRTYYLTNSQPPFFSQLVRDIYEKTGDKQWLNKMYSSLKTELHFWQSERMTQTALNRYFGTKRSEHYAVHFCARWDKKPPEDTNELQKYADAFRSLAESGWDCSSRFNDEGQNINPIDLNSLLYGAETNLAYFSKELCIGEEEKWLSLAERRKELINKLMWNQEKGAFFDYNFERQEKVDLFSAASFYPLFFNLATKEQAESTAKKLNLLEFEFGVAACENKENLSLFQWDFPNVWPPLQYMVIKGLLNYGYEEDAKRIAKKYIDTVDMNFEASGFLWEKYDAVKGSVSVNKEYATKEMMGWTAGIYMYCCELLGV